MMPAGASDLLGAFLLCTVCIKIVIMNFKPISKKYVFKDTLITDFPDYLHQPIADWLFAILTDHSEVIKADGLYVSEPYLSNSFRTNLQSNLREVFPQEWDKAIRFILTNTDRTLVILQWCLNNYATSKDAYGLEYMLATGGSGYAVELTDKNASEYSSGVYDLIERVPESIKEMAEKSFKSNDELLKAWVACFGRNPKYNEVTQICQNVLESLLRDIYLPRDAKAQLGKLIADIRSGKSLVFKGSNVVNDPNILLTLIDNVPQYRGLHKAGTGKDSTKSDAEYILLTTIYVWSLHQN
jgi:hypothetical protein